MPSVPTLNSPSLHPSIGKPWPWWSHWQRCHKDACSLGAGHRPEPSWACPPHSQDTWPSWAWGVCRPACSSPNSWMESSGFSNSVAPHAWRLSDPIKGPLMDRHCATLKNFPSDSACCLSRELGSLCSLPTGLFFTGGSWAPCGALEMNKQGSRCPGHHPEACPHVGLWEDFLQILLNLNVTVLPRFLGATEQNDLSPWNMLTLS